MVRSGSAFARLSLAAALVMAPALYVLATPSAAMADAGLLFEDQALPGPTAGQFYSAQLEASGGAAPYTFALQDGMLPPGLSLSSSGVVSGIADEPQVDEPVTSLSDINVTDSGPGARTVYGSLRITVTPSDYQAPPPLQITTTSVPEAQVSQPYSFTMTASGGTPPYRWDAVGLPNGFAMDTSGTITGSSGQEEQGTVTVEVVDSRSQYLSQYQYVPPQAEQTTFTFTVSSGVTALDPTLILVQAAVSALPGAPDILTSELYAVLDELPGGGTPGGVLGYVEGQVCQLTTGIINKSCL